MCEMEGVPLHCPGLLRVRATVRNETLRHSVRDTNQSFPQVMGKRKAQTSKCKGNALRFLNRAISRKLPTGNCISLLFVERKSGAWILHLPTVKANLIGRSFRTPRWYSPAFGNVSETLQCEKWNSTRKF